MKKILKLIFIGLLFTTTIFSQNKLEGIYFLPSPTGDFSESIRFQKTGIFEYEYSGHVGIEKYGIGTYDLNKKKLILNYNMTKPYKQSFYESENWINNRKEIELNINVRNLEGERVSRANIFILADQIVVRANENGYGKLTLEKENKNAELIISLIGYQELKIPFDKKFNYNFDVRLKSLKNGNQHLPILNQIDTLRILKKNKQELIMINQDGQKQVWTRRIE